MPHTLGIDYGSNSVRVLVVNVSSGRELRNSMVDYPSGIRIIKEEMCGDTEQYEVSPTEPASLISTFVYTP
jgi:ribulose kinase